MNEYHSLIEKSVNDFTLRLYNYTELNYLYAQVDDLRLTMNIRLRNRNTSIYSSSVRYPSVNFLYVLMVNKIINYNYLNRSF